MDAKLHPLLETWQQNREPQILEQTLTLMESETARIVKAYEEEGRTFGNLVESGVMIGLARELSEALWQQPEEDAVFSRALHCWRNIVFTTANEPATMGPLMLQYAAWQERLGDVAKAEGVYWAIVQDFTSLLEEGEEILEEDTSDDPTWQFATNDPQLYSIKYLETAARHLAAHGGAEHRSAAQAILQRMEKLPRHWDRAPEQA